MSDWTKKLIEFGDAREWKPLPTRRALKAFCAASGIEASGFAADRALRFGYAAMQQATAAERAALTDWQSVKDLMARQEQSRLAAAEAEQEAARKLIASLANKRVWTLNGLCADEQRPARYTLQEINRWVDWAIGRWVYRKPTVYAQTQHEGQMLSVDFSPFFRDVCGSRCPGSENIVELAADLASFTRECRSRQAARN